MEEYSGVTKVIPDTQETEEGRWPVQGQAWLQNEFQISLGDICQHVWGPEFGPWWDRENTRISLTMKGVLKVVLGQWENRKSLKTTLSSWLQDLSTAIWAYCFFIAYLVFFSFADLFFFFFGLCVCMYVWPSEDTSWESVLFLSHSRPRSSKSDTKHAYLMAHLPSP